jgi:hypothetical protein
LQDPRQINGDNLKNIRRKASRNFTKKSKGGAYLKDKISNLVTNSKNKNIRNLSREINRFKRSYQPRSNFFFIASGAGLSPFYCGHFWPIVPAPDDR